MPRIEPSEAVRPQGRFRHLVPGLLVYLALLLVMVSPLFWVSIPGLNDYPSHLARVWLTVQGEGAGSPFYGVQWRWIPNLAIELVVPAMSALMSVEQAGRLFVGLTMLLPVLGTILLHRVLFGRIGYWPLASLLFTYNAVLEWGFVNYLFGMGVALSLFAIWIATTRWMIAVRLLLFVPATLALFYLHLFAFGLYALLIGSWEAVAWFRRVPRSFSSLAMTCGLLLQFLPPLLLLLNGATGDGPRHTEYGGIDSKIYALVSPMGFGDLGKHAIRLVVAAALVAWVLRWVRLARGMALPIAVLVGVAILMPNWMMGSWGADMRIPVFLPFLLIGATLPTSIDRRISVTIAAAALIFFLVRVGGLTMTWIDTDRQFAEFRDAAAALPRGTRLLVVMSELSGKRPVPGVPPLLASQMHSAYFHMPMLVIIDRAAFVPYLYTSWTTIKAVGETRRPAHSVGVPLLPGDLRQALDPAEQAGLMERRDILGAPPYWVDWPQHFDAVLWIDFKRDPATLPGPVRLRHAGSFFRLYDIKPP